MHGRKNIKLYILSSKLFFSENRAVHEMMWENMAQPDRPHMTMAHAICMPDI